MSRIEDFPKTLYIFSTMKADNKPLDNEEAHSLLTDYFKATGIPFIEIEGRYKGTNELGFLMSADHVPEEAIQLYAKHGKQETYLVLEWHQRGIYKAVSVSVQSGAKEFLGYFRSMSKENIDRLNLDYTYRKDLDMYWTIWLSDTTLIGEYEKEIDAYKRTKDILG